MKIYSDEKKNIDTCIKEIEDALEHEYTDYTLSDYKELIKELKKEEVSIDFAFQNTHVFGNENDLCFISRQSILAGEFMLIEEQLDVGLHCLQVCFYLLEALLLYKAT